MSREKPNLLYLFERWLPRGAVALLAGLSSTAELAAEPFLPSASRAVSLTQNRRTSEFVTVGQSLAYAERIRRGRFKVAGLQAEHRPGEPFSHVHICYWIGAAGGQPTCGVEYLVSENPPHVVPAEPFRGLGRELEYSRVQFVRAIDFELERQRDPAAKELRDTFDQFNPYDTR
jgi:hypothetical protein